MPPRWAAARLALALAGGIADAALAQKGIELVDPTPVPGLGTPRDRVPVNVQTTTGDEIDAQHAPSLTDHLSENTASVYLNEAQSNPFQPDLLYRGFAASPLLGNPVGLSVYVDGVRVNESFGDTVNWDLIPASAIARVDVVPGSNPVFGSNTLGGALSVRTRSGDTDPGFRGEAHAGSFGRRGLELAQGWPLGAWDFFATANVLSEHGWRDESPSHLRQAFVKLGRDDDRSDVELTYTWADNDLVGNGLVPDSIVRRESRDAVYTFPDETSPTLHFGNLRASRLLADGVLLAGHLHHRRLRIDTFNGDAERDDGGTPADPSDDATEAENRATATKSAVTGGSVQLSWDHRLAGRPNRVSGGVTADLGRSRFEVREQPASFTAGRGTRPAGPFELDTDVAGRSEAFGVYLVDEWALSPSFHVTASGRYSAHRVELDDESGAEPALDGEHRFRHFAPALGAAWRAAPALTAFGGYSEGFRAPTPVELTCADPEDPCSLPVAFVADPPLDEVTARTFEFGVRGQPFAALGYRLALHRTELDDDLLFIAAPGRRGFFANVGRTRRQGLELELFGESGRFSWWASYATVDATFESSESLFNPVADPADFGQPETVEVRAGDALPGIPRHLAKLRLEYRFGERLRLGASLHHAGRQYIRGDEDNDGPEIDDYTIVSLRAEHRLTARLSLFARLDNVFDEDFETLGAFNRNAFGPDGRPLAGELGPVERFVSPGRPRTLYVGLRIAAAPRP